MDLPFSTEDFLAVFRHLGFFADIKPAALAFGVLFLVQAASWIVWVTKTSVWPQRRYLQWACTWRTHAATGLAEGGSEVRLTASATRARLLA